jgi:hypothetical protein
MRFLADENVDNKILKGLRRVLPELDLLRVQDTVVYRTPDAIILEWAAKEGRIVITHDVQTMTKYAYARIDAGLPMPGVIEVNNDTPIGRAIDDLVLMIGASSPEEFESQVKYIPIR